MPQPFEGAIMTNKGMELLTKAQAGECKIAFTRMAIGDGEYTDEEKTTEALQEHTALKSERNTYDVSNVTVYNVTTVRVTALLSNEDPYTGTALINDGYYINEIGLYAKEAGESSDTEVLYSMAVTSGGQGDYMPAYNGSNPAQITQRYYATVDNADNVTIEVVNDEFLLWDDFVDIINNLIEYEEDTETLIFNSVESGSFPSGSGGGDGGSGTGDYVLPTATSSRLGGIRIGSGLTVSSDGTTSVDFTSLANDADTSAAIVDAGTEEMTQEEINDAYDEAK